LGTLDVLALLLAAEWLGFERLIQTQIKCLSVLIPVLILSFIKVFLVQKFKMFII
jgi:hypothetical protein